MRLDDILLMEASYPHNIGAMEVVMFYKVASPEQKDEFDHLLSIHQDKRAWKLVQRVTNTKLHPMERAEVMSEPVASITVSKKGNTRTFKVLNSRVTGDGSDEYLVQGKNSTKWLRLNNHTNKLYIHSGKRDNQVSFVGELIDIERASRVA